MDVKEAAQTAKAYVVELFAEEQIVNIGLEEAEFDRISNTWKITIGFSRPWDQKNVLSAALGEGRPARSYKVMRINNESGGVESLKDRLLREDTT